MESFLANPCAWCVHVCAGLTLCSCRVLELDPESADALLGLAMIAFGSTNAQEGLNSGLQYLQRAYAADAAHPGVLCVLSHFSMLKGMYEEVRGGLECIRMQCSCVHVPWICGVVGLLLLRLLACIWLLFGRSGASAHVLTHACRRSILTDGLCTLRRCCFVCFVCACRASSLQRRRC